MAYSLKDIGDRVTALEKRPASGLSAYKNSSSGYLKFSEGFIIQWGYDSPANEVDKTVTFPIPFASACYSVTTNAYAGNYRGDDTAVHVKSISRTGFVVRKIDNFGCHWIAIGYLITDRLLNIYYIAKSFTSSWIFSRFFTEETKEV